MAGTLYSMVKPLGLVALASIVPGILLAVWVHGHWPADFAKPRAAVNPAREPPPARWLASMDPVYALAERPTLQKVCTPAQDQPQYMAKTVYEFVDEQISPDPLGPRGRERSRRGLPRELRQMQAILKERQDALRQCYRWARYEQRSLQGTVRLSVQIDPFGAWATPQVVPEMAGGAPLADCVGVALAKLQAVHATPRNTEAEFRIRFVPSDQQKPRQLPARPTARLQSASSGAACLLLPDPVPTDHLVQQEPLLEVGDYDAQQAREDEQFDFQQKLATWRSGGQLGPRPIPSPVVITSDCGMNVRHGVGRDGIRRSLRYNFGAYGACYAEALARHPGLAGRVVLAIKVDAGGSLTVRVQNSTADDVGVAECLRQAVAEVWLEPWEQGSGQVDVLYPLLLVPEPTVPSSAVPRHDTIAGIEARAQAQLQQGDGNGALRSYSALLRQVPSHPHRCQWQAGALEATLVLAPWVDERVLAVAKDLVGGLARDPSGVPQPLRSACLETAAPLLAQLATDPHRLGVRYQLMSLLDVAVQRYRLILGIGPDVPDAYQLRYYLAEALWTQERYCEAAPVYARVALGDPFGPKHNYATAAAFLAGQYCLHWDEDPHLSTLPRSPPPEPRAIDPRKSP